MSRLGIHRCSSSVSFTGTHFLHSHRISCQLPSLRRTCVGFVKAPQVHSASLRRLSNRRKYTTLIRNGTPCMSKEDETPTPSTQIIGAQAACEEDSNGIPDQLELLKKFMTGRFDNARQIEEEIRVGQQVTPFAIHVNTPLEDYMDNIPEDFDSTKTFHVLEETYKWHPGHRNAMVRPLLLRFDLTVNGSLKLTSLAVPDDLDAASVRHDNPMLRFDYHELRQSKTFPFSPVYDFDREALQFSLDVTVSPTEDMKVSLVEKLSENTLHVHERVWKDGALVFGYYETPIIYERKYA